MRRKYFSLLVMTLVLLNLSLISGATVTRSFVPSSPAIGSSVTVNLDVSALSGGESYFVLSDRFPAGWSVTDSGSGDVGTDGVWRETVNPAAVGVRSYVLQVPMGANGIYDFVGSYGIVLSAGGTSQGSIGGSGSLSVSGPGTVVRLSPSLQSVQTGSSFSVDVYVNNSVNLYGVQFDLAYDDAVLDLVGVVSSSELLGQNIGAGTLFDANTWLYGYDSPGLIDNYFVLRSGVGSGVTGSGKIATITFNVPFGVSSGSVNLILSNVVLSDPNSASLISTLQNAQVNVGRCGDGVTQTDLGETCDDSNSVEGDGCSSDCRIEGCVARGGDVCAAEEVCNGNEQPNADSAVCCDVTCTVPTWTSCGECGAGLFNVCDRNECENSIVEDCFLTDDLIPGDGYGTCSACGGASCSSYGSDSASCSNDVCGLAPPTCVFAGSCQTATTEINCADGIDNDADAVVDCADFDCAGIEGPNAGVLCCQGAGDCTQGECTVESCLANECSYQNRLAGDYAECSGACEACDSPGGSCAPVGLADEGNLCVGECTYCLAGACVDRPQFDFDECTSTCTGCSGLPGSTCQPFTYTEGPQCQDAGQTCSAGTCCADANGDDLCDSCSFSSDCSNPYPNECAVATCSGFCGIDNSGCDCIGADVTGEGDVDVNDLVAIVLALQTPNPASDVDGNPGVDIRDLVYVATRISVCNI